MEALRGQSGDSFDVEQIEPAMIRLLDWNFRNNPCEFEGYRNFDNMVKAIRAYNSFYPKEDFAIDINPRTGFPYVEQPFAVDTHKMIRGRRIIYIGKIDLRVRFSPTEYYTMDHKFIREVGEDFWSDQAVTAQHPGYIWADRECTGNEATGYIVNAICVRKSIEGATFDPVLGKVKAGTTSRGKESTAVPVEFQRQRFFTKVPPGQIEEWYDNMLAVVDRFLYSVDADMFPRHRCQCVRKYGKCQFYEVCSLPAFSRENALMSGAYEDNDWTPLYN